MALPSLYQLVAYAVTFYLSTLLLFQLLRVFTGISIQRIGFSGLRRISYKPKNGIEIEIRALGLKLHRPSFAQPTWMSIVFSSPKITIDLEAFGRQNVHVQPSRLDEPVQQLPKGANGDKPAQEPSRGTAWVKLARLKQKLKDIHRVIPWLRLVDIFFHKTLIEVRGVGLIEIGNIQLSVDTRSATVDRNRPFQHKKAEGEAKERPVEWVLVTRNILLTPEARDPLRILDYSVFTVHGFLNPHVGGLRDVSVLFKLGRLNLPFDDFHHCKASALKKKPRPTIDHNRNESSETTDSGPPEDEAADAFAALRSQPAAHAMLKSMIQGIREITVAIGFLGISRRIQTFHAGQNHVYFNMSLKEVGMDVHRVDASHPAHAMYFGGEDAAHQVLLSATSLSCGLDDGHQAAGPHEVRLLSKPILYVPMTTATIRTTVPSKILQFSMAKDTGDRNTNAFFSTLVVTSPSIDLDARELQLILALAANRPQSSKSMQHRGHRFFSRLLPKSTVKISMHEPVIRLVVPPVSQTKDPVTFNHDLIISETSSIALDVASSHAPEQDMHYSLSSVFRISSTKLSYQTTSRERHDLSTNEYLELKLQLVAAPDVSVLGSLHFQTFSVLMMQPEINEAIRHLVHQLHTDVKPEKLRKPKTSRNPNFLRALPPWLQHFEVHAADFNMEVAGADEELSPLQRGLVIHLDSWSAEYKASKDEEIKQTSRRRGGSMTLTKEADAHLAEASKDIARRSRNTDGRRIAFHIRRFEALVIDGLPSSADEPLISLPRAEIALTTASDNEGPMLHVHGHIKTIFLHYSLFKHYCIGVVVVMLRKTFSKSHHQHTTHHNVDTKPLAETTNAHQDSHEHHAHHQLLHEKHAPKELVCVDVKVVFIQLKARLPTDPYMMLQLHGMEFERSRWSHPSAQIEVARLYAESPQLPGTWSRIISIKNPRMQFRKVNHKAGDVSIREPAIEIGSDAIRIGVPHQMVVHKIFENIVNTIKTVKQLQHRFDTESDEYVLGKTPEGPKNIPRIQVRTHVLLFEIEDSAFEFKLGAIYRAGLVEQKVRLAREEAFHAKCRKLYNTERKSTKSDTQGSVRPRNSTDTTESRNHPAYNLSVQSEIDGEPRNRSPVRSEHGKARMRYDPDGGAGFSASHETSIDEAWYKLQRLNAQSWRKRIMQTLSYQSGAVQDIRNLFWPNDGAQDEVYHKETILKIPQRPALMSILMSDISITIDKPSFAPHELPDFMYKVGKGLPKDTKFGLLVPMHWKFDMGETRMTLRDYPLPLIHIPALKSNQSSKLPSWSLETDFVVGEEFRDYNSTRDIKIVVIPTEKMQPGTKPRSFAIDVRRTVSPVKTYSDLKIRVNTAQATRFTWGSSYQPAIQDMMQVIEGFTKPQLDPSEKVGFWDKLRLSFHSHVNMTWVGGGDVQLMLKGTRDPYVVTGHGAGLVMVWRNNVQLNIWKEEDPQKFMTVDSGDYLLAVPDFSRYARESPLLDPTQAHASNAWAGPLTEASLKKVVMKLSGKVQWRLGLVFERDLPGGGRSFEFEPHYKVTLKNPAHLKSIKNDEDYDAFRGFRSNHIHMSIGILAPSDRTWTSASLAPSKNYNSVHLTPRFFTHFYSWWGMFSGAMSLPVRQGPLWPGPEKSGKKFGRHLATIKYSLLLSPLFISHIYKHKDVEDYSDDYMSATGLKMRLDLFVLDLHQRREEFRSQVKGMDKTVTTTGMKMNQALLDLVSADLRAVSATISGTTQEDLKRMSDEDVKKLSSSRCSVDLNRFTIPDDDFSWIDVDDFVEIDWTLPLGSDPETKILPLAFAPRFTYRRQTDHNNMISGDADRHSPFGYEDTHQCVIHEQSDAREVQIELIQKRYEEIEERIAYHSRHMEEHESYAREGANEVDNRREELRGHMAVLERKRRFLRKMLRDLHHRIEVNDPRPVAAPEEMDAPHSHPDMTNQDSDPDHEDDMDSYTLDESTMADHVTDFNNRFVVHNAQIKWNNSLRNVVLRYMHQVSQRRGYVYYTSRRAVKFILDIIEEQHKAKNPSPPQQSFDQPDDGSVDSGESPIETDDVEVQKRIQELLQDGRNFVDADDAEDAKGNRKTDNSHQNSDEVVQDFLTQNTYHVRLVAPQIQLQSEKHSKAAVLVTARGMRLMVYQIMDKDRLFDDVSGLVQRRFAAEMDNVQFFVTSKSNFATEFVHMYAGHRYGTQSGSSWPPWVPIEVMFDFGVNSYGFSRVVQRTSASLRYDKYNKLRLKYNDNVSDGSHTHKSGPQRPDNRMDHLWVDFPALRAICDSNQYYAMYIIVLDLLLWSEPLEKTRNERLEKIMLASDFSDLRGAPEMVMMLQERIRQLDELKMHFHMNEKFLDRRGWQDRISMDQDLAGCEDELFFMMKAITTSQRKNDEKLEGTQSTAVLRWNITASEIVWHLTMAAQQPLVEFQLGNAAFERTEHNDGSNRNIIEIDRIHGLNLLADAVYPEMIGAFLDGATVGLHDRDSKMLRVDWLSLEAIAGIPVVDHFEINLYPLKVQLEYETAKKLFDYVFPKTGVAGDTDSPVAVRNAVPREDDDDDEVDEEAAQAQRDASLRQESQRQDGKDVGAGPLGERLMATHDVPAKSGTSSSQPSGAPKRKPLGERFKVPHFANDSSISFHFNGKKLGHKKSDESMAADTRGRDGRRPSTASTQEEHKKKRFHINIGRRSTSSDSRKDDDLSQMMDRASNYMTLAYVKIPSVVLSLSYKGKGSRNFEDVHDLVFKLPTLEYRNKTWSNLDLTNAVKRDVIRALISHMGAIIGNKFSKHKPGKQQQSRLRELANSSVMLSTSDVSTTSLASVSERNDTQDLLRNGGDEDERRISDVTDGDSFFYRSDSQAASMDSTREGIHEAGDDYNEGPTPMADEQVGLIPTKRLARD